METLPTILWPTKFDPAIAPIHVRNEINASVSPEAVWEWLVRAEAWPSWYPNSADVVIKGGGEVLLARSRFRWRTFGVALHSVVEEFDPPSRIAWSAKGIGVEAYHAWLIEPTHEGVHILTEETQYGWLARLGAVFLPRRMHRQHEIWLKRLSAQAAGGPPPSIEVNAGARAS